MSIFGNVFRVTLDVLEVPFAIVKDVATLGGTLSDNGHTYTGEKMDQIQNDYDKLKKK